jgi:T1SS-143 domain-containing protein
MATSNSNQANISGNQPIGTAQIVQGTVHAQSADNSVRVLQANSPVFLNDRIITGENGMISITFSDASRTQLDLGRTSDVLLNEEVFQETTPAEFSEATAEVAQIQEALIAGEFDPTTDIEPTAAGPTAAGGPASDGGGSSFVEFTLTGEEVTPTSGAETTGVGLDFLDPQLSELEEVLIVEPEPEPAPAPAPAPAPVVAAEPIPTSDIPPPPPPPPDLIPVADDEERTLNEANFQEGTDPDLTDADGDGNPATLSTSGVLADFVSDFGDGPGGLTFVNFDGSDTETIPINGDGTAFVEVTGEFGLLVVRGDGTWTYTIENEPDIFHDNPNATGADDIQQDLFDFTVFDSDGDTDTGTLTINILDDGPVAIAEPEGIHASVEEDDMSLSDGDLSDGNNEDGSVDADEASSSTFGSVTSLFTVGADDPGTYGITEDTDLLDDLTTLFSKGDQVTYSSDGTTLTATAGGREVFTLTVNGDGSWDFDLKDQLDHVDDGANDENLELVTDGDPVDGIDFSSILTVTDTDGDSATGAAAGSFIVTVQDDIPVAVLQSEGISATVEEDDMASGDGDLSDGNNEDGSTDQDEASGGAGSLSALFSVGADEPADYGITENGEILGDLTTLYSKGDQVTYSSNGTTLTGTADGREVFTLTVNGDGSWDFDLKDQLDHVDDGNDDENLALVTDGAPVDGIDFSSILTVTDEDGDTVTGAAAGAFVINVEDDIPVAEAEPTIIEAYVEEDDMTGAAGGDLSLGNNEDGSTNADEDSGSGASSIASLFSIGSDEDVEDAEAPQVSYGFVTDVSGLTALGLTSQGVYVHFTSDGQTLTATATAGPTVGREILTITIDADTGEWDVDLKDQFDHVAGDDENTALQGTDGPIDSLDLSAYLTATDYDGDTVIGAAEGSFILTIEDDIPMAVLEPQGISATVQEDDMRFADGDQSDGNNEDGSTNQDEASGGAGSLSALFSVGADEPADYGITENGEILGDLTTLYSKGDQVTYSSDGTTLTATADGREVFTLTVNGDGSWDFDLKDQLDHVDDGNDDENLALVTDGDPVDGIDFSSILTVTDEDGDTVTGAAAGAFVINVEDDVPLAILQPRGISATVEEDDMAFADGDLSDGNNEDGSTDQDEASGGAGSLSALFTVGADEPAEYGITENGEILGDLSTLYSKGDQVTYSSDGTTLTATADGREVFTLTVNGDGSWDFDLKDQLDHVDDGNDDENLELVTDGAPVDGIDFSSILTVTDEDGDTVTGAAAGSFIINVQDDVPVAVIEPEGISATVLEDGMSFGTGDLSEGNKDNGETNAADEASGGAGSLSALFSVGADEPATYGITEDEEILGDLSTLYSKGDQVTYSSDGTTLTATADGREVFTLTVNGDGSWDFDLNDQLDHVDDGNDDENYALVTDGAPVDNIDFSSIITVTDKDNDTIVGAAVGAFVIMIQDDIPVAAMEPEGISATVLEDGMSLDTGDLSEGNKESGETTATDEAAGVEGSLIPLFSVGADEPASYGITEDQALLDELITVYSQGEAVTYSSDGTTLTATADGREVFSLTVNNDGSWNFDLNDQLDHVDDGANDENLALVTDGDSVNSIDFSSILTVTDEDGDTVTGAAAGAFLISVVDDVPIIGTPQDSILGLEEGNQLTASLDIIGIGADEPPASLTITLTEGAPVLTTAESGGQQMTNSGDPLYWHENDDGSWSAVTESSPGVLDADAKSFTVSLDAATGTYTVVQNDGLDGGATTTIIDFSTALNGGNTYEAVFGSGGTSNTVGDITTHAGGIFIWARGSADNTDPFGWDGLTDTWADDTATVNYASQGVGVDTGATIEGDGGDVGADRESEILSFKFYSTLTVDESGNSQEAVRIDESQSTALDLTGVTLVLDHLGTAESAYYTLWNDGVQVSGQYEVTNTVGPAGGSSADQNDYSLVIDSSQLNVGETVFDEVRLESSDGDYRVASAEVTVFQEGFDQTIEVPFELTDYDGDTATGDFSITFDGNGIIDAESADALDGDESTNGMVIAGSSEDETITGSDYDDTIFGGGGDDTISGGDGDDTIVGGDGEDTIDGGAGEDTIFGGDDDDTIVGGDDNDTIVGGDGSDDIDGGSGDDIIYADEGNIDDGDLDEMTGGTGDDTFVDPGNNDDITDFSVGDVEMDTLVPPPEEPIV